MSTFLVKLGKTFPWTDVKRSHKKANIFKEFLLYCLHGLLSSDLLRIDQCWWRIFCRYLYWSLLKTLKVKEDANTTLPLSVLALKLVIIFSGGCTYILIKLGRKFINYIATLFSNHAWCILPAWLIIDACWIHYCAYLMCLWYELDAIFF